MRQQLWTRSPFALTLLLVVGIAYSLARAGWFFTAGPTGATTAVAQPKHRVGTAALPTTTFDLERVANQHLFGIAAPTVDANAVTNVNAPVTQLALELLGVFEAADKKESTAVIAEHQQDGEVYAIGQSVPGNAVLTEVHADRVVLKRGNAFETLRFPDSPDTLNMSDNATLTNIGGEGPNGDGVDTQILQQQAVEAAEAELAQPVTEPPQASSAAGVGNSVASYGNRFKADPNRVLTELGVQPIATDSADGYRIGSTSGAPGFAQVGLQPGDVVLSVNGQAIGNVRNDRQQIDSIRSQGSARLEVQRGNRRFFVTASLH